LSFNVDHALALTFLGAGALYLLYLNHTEAATALLGVLGGYAFKNGLVNHKSPVS